MTRRAALRDRTKNAPTPPPPASSLRESINLWIYRYNLTTALYMLEPWERACFNVLILAVLAYIAYGLCRSTLHPLWERIAVSYM